MALSTYTELVDSVSAWLNRDDMDAYIPDFVTAMEAGLNRDLRVRQMIVRAVTTPPADEPREELPVGYLELKALQFNSNPITVPEYVTPAWMRAYRRQSSTSSGAPTKYTIEGSQFLFDTTPAGLMLEIMYYQRIPSLEAAGTNWLLSAHPDIYLYGTLIHSAPFLKDDERVAVWDTLYSRAIESLKMQDKRSEVNAAPVAMRARPGRNIP